MKIKYTKKIDVSQLPVAGVWLKKLSISEMYSTNAMERSVVLSEFCFDGMNISSHKLYDINA